MERLVGGTSPRRTGYQCGVTLCFCAFAVHFGYDSLRRGGTCNMHMPDVQATAVDRYRSNDLCTLYRLLYTKGRHISHNIY